MDDGAQRSRLFITVTLLPVKLGKGTEHQAASEGRKRRLTGKRRQRDVSRV